MTKKAFDMSDAKRVARASGGTVATIASYLIHCRSEADAWRSIEALRTNQPQLFPAPKGQARNSVKGKAR